MQFAKVTSLLVVLAAITLAMGCTPYDPGNHSALRGPPRGLQTGTPEGLLGDEERRGGDDDDEDYCPAIDECSAGVDGDGVYPCPGTRNEESFCEDRDPDNFCFKCQCLPGFAPTYPAGSTLVPARDDDPQFGFMAGDMVQATADGIPTVYRPLACLRIPTGIAPAPTPAPVAHSPPCGGKCDLCNQVCNDSTQECECKPEFPRVPNSATCRAVNPCGTKCALGAICTFFPGGRSDETNECQDPGASCICPTGTVGEPNKPESECVLVEPYEYPPCW